MREIFGHVDYALLEFFNKSLKEESNFIYRPARVVEEVNFEMRVFNEYYRAAVKKSQNVQSKKQAGKSKQRHPEELIEAFEPIKFMRGRNKRQVFTENHKEPVRQKLLVGSRYKEDVLVRNYDEQLANSVLPLAGAFSSAKNQDLTHHLTFKDSSVVGRTPDHYDDDSKNLTGESDSTVKKFTTTGAVTDKSSSILVARGSPQLQKLHQTP